MAKKRIAILGAGPAGLAVALKLLEQEQHYEITFIEKESEPGGLARSLIIAGSPADLGPHRIFTLLPEIKQFYKEFLGDALFVVPRKSQMYLNGAFLNYPLKLTDAFKHLGVTNTIRYGLSALSSSLMPAHKNNDVSFDDVMKKAFGAAVYNDIIRPYAAKTWKISPDRIDAEVARLRVSAGGFTKIVRQVLGMEKAHDPSALPEFHYLEGGFQEVIDTFVTSFEGKPVAMITDASVEDVRPLDDGSISVAWKKNDTSPEQQEFDFCFSTIPLDELISVLNRNIADKQAADIAANLRYISTILFFVVVKKPQISANTWLYFPEQFLIFNRGYETANFNIHHPTTDKAVICLEVTCYRGDTLWATSDDELATNVVRDIASTGLFTEEQVDETKVVRLSHAYPLLTRGYKKDLDVLWNYLQRIPSLITLGRQGLFQHNNMDHAIYTAFRAVDVLQNSPEPEREWYTRELPGFKDFRIID